MRPADTREVQLIARAMNAPFLLNGSPLEPRPIEDAKEAVAGAISNLIEFAEPDDYFIGQLPDTSWYTTCLGIMNSTLAQMLPGVAIGPGPDGTLALWIDEDRFYAETIPDLQQNKGFGVDLG